MTRMVEKRASTVDDAVAAALDELGVSRDEATVEVLSEGRRGLFSGRTRAHVRVTAEDASGNGEGPSADGAVVTEPAAAPDAPSADGAAPTGAVAVDDDDGAADDDAGGPVADETVDPTVETDRETDGEADGEAAGVAIDATATTDADAAAPEASGDRLGELNEEADLAADFVEGLLDILELPGDIEIDVDENQAFVNVVEVGSGLLIGRRGATLEALQELVRAATQRQVERRSHVRIDIEGYRQRQLDKMRDRCRDGIARVRETGEPYRLEPMDAYERKVMHDLVARTGGVTSASEGVEPRRRVVVYAEE